MSENALETLVDELYKNGIAVEGYELTGRASGEPKKVLRTVFELDFSEHDKVFEDKIAELKKDYKTASELLGKYQQENESLKKRIIELEDFSCQAEQETESLVEKLKQRIAELESKKRKRPCFVSYVGVENINGKEYVSMEKFATAMEELNTYFDGFFDRTDEDTMQKDIMRKWGI